MDSLPTQESNEVLPRIDAAEVLTAYLTKGWKPYPGAMWAQQANGELTACGAGAVLSPTTAEEWANRRNTDNLQILNWSAEYQRRYPVYGTEYVEAFTCGFDNYGWWFLRRDRELNDNSLNSLQTDRQKQGYADGVAAAKLVFDEPVSKEVEEPTLELCESA